MSREPGRRALEVASFFMADMQAGIGPFLGILLLAHGWRIGRIGTVMTIGALAGVAMTTPAGALVDRSRHKRGLTIALGICTMVASGVVLATQEFWLVALSQVATAVAGAAVGPAVTGITLGLVRQRGFARQNGRNQVFNHAGNLVGAALSGLLGWKLGLSAVFWLAVAFGVLSVIAVLRIPADAIDDDAARGLEGKEGGGASGWRSLLQSRALIVLAIALLCFHLGNAAMLPLLGMELSANHTSDPAANVAITIVVAQGVMVVVSALAVHLEGRVGGWLVLLVSFLALPVRGLVAAKVEAHWGMYPVQVLDGVGAGLQSVAVPNLVARALNGTGRVNVGQGAVMTAQGIGASLSPAVGGWLAETLGYRTSFGLLGLCAVPSIAIWLASRSTFREESY